MGAEKKKTLLLGDIGGATDFGAKEKGLGNQITEKTGGPISDFPFRSPAFS